MANLVESPANITDKRSARKAENRIAIVEAAESLILEGGYGALNAEALAERAGVSRRTIFNHFASVDDVLFEEYSHVILERTYDIFLERYLAAYPDLPYLRVAVFASNLAETIGEGVYYYLTRAEEMTVKVAAEAPEGTHPEALAIEAMRQCVLEALDYLGRLVQGEFAS